MTRTLPAGVGVDCGPIDSSIGSDLASRLSPERISFAPTCVSGTIGIAISRSMPPPRGRRASAKYAVLPLTSRPANTVCPSLSVGWVWTSIVPSER